MSDPRSDPVLKQYHTAIDHIKGRRGTLAGLYMIRPRWAGSRNLVKIGMTKDIHSRLHGAYRHSIPSAAGSFELIAFMRVGVMNIATREKTLKNNSTNQNGWVKPTRDDEWREHFNPQTFTADIKRLFQMTRRPVGDGNIYLFDPITGKSTWTGGRPAEIDRAAEKQNRTNVQLRSQEHSRIYGFDESDLARYNAKFNMTLQANNDSQYQRILRSVPRKQYGR